MDKVYPGTTLTKDWKQLQPLPCPTGFAKASKKQLNQYIKRFLYDYITNQKVHSFIHSFSTQPGRLLLEGGPLWPGQPGPPSPPGACSVLEGCAQR